MKAETSQKNNLTLALLSFAVLMLGLLYWEWYQGMGLERELSKMRKIPATPVQLKAILPEFVLPDVEAGFPELISRSLFSVNRRSSATVGKGGRTTMKKGQFVLVGVLITPTQRSALLRDVQTNKTETVPILGVVRGLTLDAVDNSRAVLRQGVESEELTLIVQTGSKVPAAPQMTVPQPQPTVTAKVPPASPASAAVVAASPLPAGSKPLEVASAPKAPPPRAGVQK